MHLKPRLKREFLTISYMLHIYCSKHHNSKEESLCNECTDLKEYAKKQLLNCPFLENKPTCTHCPIHCYQKDMQLKIKEVMRFSGPRMAYKHPILALLHLLDGKRKPPQINKDRRKKQ